MKTKKEELHRRGWKSRFVRLTAIGIATIAVTTVTLVVSCGKEEQKQEQEQPTPQQKHNVELVYGQNNETQWQNISLDTLNKYNADPTVDTIFMVPERSNQFSTLSTNQLKNYLVPLLRERHNVNPNKVFGKGDLELKYSSIENNREIVRFFADTLRHHVIFNNYSK